MYVDTLIGTKWEFPGAANTAVSFYRDTLSETGHARQRGVQVFGRRLLQLPLRVLLRPWLQPEGPEDGDLPTQQDLDRSRPNLCR